MISVFWIQFLNCREGGHYSVLLAPKVKDENMQLLSPAIFSAAVQNTASGLDIVFPSLQAETFHWAGVHTKHNNGFSLT